MNLLLFKLVLIRVIPIIEIFIDTSWAFGYFALSMLISGGGGGLK